MLVRILAALPCAVTCLLALLPTSAARAQPVPQSAVTSFAADEFARSQPSSAYDMVLLLPGFRLLEGDTDLRGYSGAAGNVLIDGRHPATKEATLEELLKRIPARSVERLELIRSSASGYDMQGYALIANVVRERGGRLAGRIDGEFAWFDHGYSAPRITGDLSFQSDERTFDLQGARYREIDDEHGFGSRDRHAPDGSPLRLGDYKQAEGTDNSELTGSFGQPLAGGTLRASALFKDSAMFADIRHDISFPAEELVFGAERENTRATEGSLRFNRPGAAGGQVELLAIRRDTRVGATDTSRDSGGNDVTREDSDASESILRGVFQRKWTPLSLEVGAEGSLNALDSRVALVEDGLPVPLPAAAVRVEEERVELFATATWHPASALAVESGLRYETSRLTQSGASDLSKSLDYLKPRLLVNFEASERDQLRLLIEREVGQLDFDDFVSDPSLTSGTVTAGNQDLEPGTLWLAELAWEHHFGPGSVVLTGRQEWLSDVVDRIPVFSPEGVFDAVGNIGDGRRSEIQLDADLPLDGIRLTGFTLRGTLLLRESSVTDPQTGEERRISEDAPTEAAISLTQDLPALFLRWGVNYVSQTEEIAYKVDEVERNLVSDRVDAFVEYKPDDRWTFRLFGKNLTDSPVIRDRDIYAGLRGGSALDYFERRVLRSGPYFGISVMRAFGS